MGTVRVGVSGWDYDAWEGDVYPDDLPASERLAWIAERYRTVEVNGSFYGLLDPSTYRRWREATPRGFRFAVKGSRFITHSKSLRDARVALANFFASGVLALEDRLGPVLWQLPERHRFRRERLESFLELLPRDTEGAAELAAEHDGHVSEPLLEVDGNHRLRHVVEPRHRSFFGGEAVRVLRDAGVALAFSHAEEWPLREEVTAGFVYIRLHGAPRTYHSGYDDAELDEWARRIRAWARAEEPDDPRRITELAAPPRKSRDVYVYFDNDAEARAPHDARALAERVE